MTTLEFLETWDATHRLASAYYLNSNGRADVLAKVKH